MLRSIIAVVASLIVMFVLVMAVFAGLWFGLGPDALLQPGTFKGTTLFAIAVPIITVVTRLVGGWLCATIARGSAPVLVLAGLVLALGLVMLAVTLRTPETTEPRTPGMSADEMLDRMREPTWLSIFNAVGGAGAVLVGGLVLAAPRRPR